MLDYYRKNLLRKQEELSKLQQDKAREQNKIATLANKISSASMALSRSSNLNTAQSKLREIERYQKEQATAEKKVADFDGKIARKYQEIAGEQRKISMEEIKQAKALKDQYEKQARAQKAQIALVNNTLYKHEIMHLNTNLTLTKLQELPEKIIVLFLASNPRETGALQLDEEARSIAEMIRKSKYRDSVEFQTRWAVQPMDVLQALNELNPTIVHFSGHGSDSDEIVFQDGVGNAKFVSKEAIVQTMMASSSNIRLVFFNTCYSYKQAEAVTKHVEAAIGMSNSVDDYTARVFSSQFYSSIAFGCSVKQAFEQAKALLMLEGIKQEEIPQLFVGSELDAGNLIIVKPANLDQV